MSIKLILSSNLTYLLKGKEVFEVGGETVGECINHLVSVFPAIRNAIFYESGTHLNQSVTVLVNEESAEGRDRLAKAVKDGDEIHIMLKRH